MNIENWKSIVIDELQNLEKIILEFKIIKIVDCQDFGFYIVYKNIKYNNFGFEFIENPYRQHVYALSL